ncbi:uncharacterized protein TNCV_3492221 [Trichonephila clavipes]|nr:uncharacterized protein TNCV_3492221 [Trichonephila clavipes]
MTVKLAKEGCNLPIPSSSALTYVELLSLRKSQNSVEWRVPPTQHWYAGNRLGLALPLKCDRGSQITLSRLAIGHI